MAGRSGPLEKGRAEPVDATNVPADLRGARTVWNAFHHSRPEQARSILANAVADRQAIAVFEVVSRELPMLLAPGRTVRACRASNGFA